MKKIIIAIALVVVIALGVFGYFLLSKEDVGFKFITIDINPSFKIVPEKGLFKTTARVEALNEDAKAVIRDVNKNNSETLKSDNGYNDLLESIIKSSINLGFIKDSETTVLVHFELEDKAKEEVAGKIIESFKNRISEVFTENNMTPHAIETVDKISDSAKELAKQYNISETKAAYIEKVAEKSEALKVETLINKPLTEIADVEKTGKYCDEGYTLEGDFCVKLDYEERAQNEKVCPENFEEINGKCYLTTSWEETKYCDSNLALQNNKCVGNKTVDASAKCTTGTYNSSTKKCEVLTYESAGTKSCKTCSVEPCDQMMSNGRCSGGKWAHDDNTCEGADKFIADNSGGPNAGWCYNPQGDYDAIVTCPSGTKLTTGSNGKGCYKTTSSEPSYYCQGTGELDGNKCTGTVSENPKTKKSCSGEYKLYQDRICVNYNQTKEYINGFKCTNENAKLEGEICKVYDIVDAKSY